VSLETIDDLAPDPENPRRPLKPKEAAALQASMRKYGDLSGVTWNKRTGELVCGHKRVEQLKDMGAQFVGGSLTLASGDKFPVRVVDWPRSKQKGANVAANNQLLAADYSADLLAPYLSDVMADLSPEDFAGLRFDDLARDLKIPLTNMDEETSGGADEELPKDPITKPGDLWVLGDHRLLCGDSTDKAQVDRLLDGEAPLLMVTDPPYGVEYDPTWRDEFGQKSHSNGRVLNDDQASWPAAYRNVNADVAYVWHADIHAHTVAHDLISCGFDLRAMIIWTKQHFAMSRGHYHWQHEPCWYAVQKGSKAHWRGGRKQTTLWEIRNKNTMGGAVEDMNTTHGTQKPLECMGRPIENHGKRGDLVCDPFLGSGTTIIAAERLGRRCRGVELSPGYCDMIVERWERETGGKAKRG